MSARLAGRRARFEVEVREVSSHALTVRASGPFRIDASYALLAVPGGTELTIGLDLAEPRGLPGRALLRAATVLLETGLLRLGVARFGVAAARSLTAA